VRASIVLVIIFMLGCQGDPEKCEQAVRNFATLVYWQQADAKIAAAAPADRDALRKQKLAEFTGQLERGMPTLVSQCQAANNSSQITCMIDAKTADQAKACTK
jgi:hypothetical protein